MQFYSPTQIHINSILRDNYGNVVDGEDGTPVENVGYLHLIEHRFVLSTFKSKLVRQILEQLPSQTATLIVDIVSGWKEFSTTICIDEKQIFYMNSPSLLHFDTLINFLVQLNEDPEEALRRCSSGYSVDLQLATIVLDNISYYTHDNASYDLLFKVLRMLRQNYGCAVVTVGYGLEYYDGVEKYSESRQSFDIPTRLPMSYVKNMDCVLVRDTDSSARVVLGGSGVP